MSPVFSGGLGPSTVVNENSFLNFRFYQQYKSNNIQNFSQNVKILKQPLTLSTDWSTLWTPKKALFQVHCSNKPGIKLSCV